MKIIVGSGLLAPILFWLVGVENLFFMIHDKEDLFIAVADKIGKMTVKVIDMAAQIEGVGAIFCGDDLGFKTSSMFSPEYLRKRVFPWHKKFSDVTHKYGKTFWYHCCGYKDNIIEDLIENVKIDVLHSFEESCCPVTNYVKKYGDKIGFCGGIDMDKLSRSDEPELREYIRNVLDIGMDNGRHVLGSGNSVSNYIPVNNYLVMLDEGYNWSKHG